MTSVSESSLGRAHRGVYEFLCGRHPALRPWHFQWLPAYFLSRGMARWLVSLGGNVLDLGCGQQPYRPLFGSVQTYIGVDHSTSSRAEVVAKVGKGLPFSDGTFDVVLMAQVMEYLAEPRAAIAEIRRVLRPRGVAVVSFPFIFNEHGAHDFIRLSGRAIDTLFAGFDVRSLERQGGIGTTLAILSLNWLDLSLNRTFALRLCRPLLLPLWLPFCATVNLIGLIVDRFDVTKAFYSNVFLVLVKPDDSTVTEGGAMP